MVKTLGVALFWIVFVCRQGQDEKQDANFGDDRVSGSA